MNDEDMLWYIAFALIGVIGVLLLVLAIRGDGMSKKYVIELDDRIKLVTSVGVTENGVVYTTSDYVYNLEELNSDYIKEHFGELQDEAYRKGFEDGKKSVSDPDRIEVGDEVTAPCGKAVITAFKNDLVFYLYSVGDCGCTELENITKTGKHYDIQSILEVMRT